MEEIFLSDTSEATQQFAKEFAKKLHGGDVVCLYGNLGAGKTTFVQGLAKGLGIEKRIISPTFIIVRSYSCHSGKHSASRIKEGSWSSQDDAVNFYHVDLYRLQSEKEIENTGLLDFMGKEENIVVIEWPERLGGFKPEKKTEIYFEVLSEQQRKITIKN